MENTRDPIGDVVPSLTYNDASAAIEFLCKAFGFTRRLVVPGPSETIMHSELSLDRAVIMVSSPKPEMNRVSPEDLKGVSQALTVYVSDPDSHYLRAIKHGATIVQELKNEDYGSRGYMANDVEGHVWYFGTYRPGEYWER